MAVKESQLRANKKYQSKFDRLQIRVSPEEKLEIARHAESMQESTNAFVRRAIMEAMARDREKLQTD